MSNKEIQVRRRERTNTTLPPEVLNEARLKIGSVFDGTSPLSGLSTAEEKKYLPGLIGVGPDNHVEWPKRIKAFWAEMSVIVPSAGTVLQIGVDSDGEPTRLMDWIKFKWLKRHPRVGNTFGDMTSRGCDAYIFDPEEENEKLSRENRQKKAAYIEYMKLTDPKKSDEKRVDRVVRVLMGVNPTNMTSTQKEIELEKIAYNEPARFHKVVTDRDLDIRAEIEDMIGAGILDKIGSHIKFGTDTLGHSMEETIEYFKDKTNVKTISTLKTRLEAGVGVSEADLAE
jgi:hypothetical protein